MRIERIHHCRACKSDDLAVVVDLGTMASCGIFPKAWEPNAPKAPLQLVQCGHCSLVQLAHDFDGAELYRTNYGYRSGINETMVAHLRGIVERLSKKADFRPGDIILDIGSNDGTLLGCYSAEGVRRVGIDPTIERFGSYYKPGIKKVADFFNWNTFSAVFKGEQAKVITSISMFYDLPDPAAFVADIAKSLREDGIWVMEQSYLPTMIDRNSFDTICHEHLEYYCLHQIRDLAQGAGLRVLDVTLNDINGGSFQVWLGHEHGPHRSNSRPIDAMIAREVSEGYLGGAPFQAFGKRLRKIQAKVLTFLDKQKEQGKLVHGYGASTKGNTLLQMFEISPELLPAIADRNEEKFGSRTPGTNIPIISEADSRAQKPDFYLVLPWHFRDGFIKRETEFLARGGRFVFPLPEFEIYPALKDARRA